MSPDYSFLFTWLYSVFGLISFHVPLLAFSCSSFACDIYIFFLSLRLVFVVLRMVGLCNFVLKPISGGVQGLFVGFVHYVLEGLLTVTFLVIEPDIKLSLKHCKLSMTLVVCWRMVMDDGDALEQTFVSRRAKFHTACSRRFNKNEIQRATKRKMHANDETAPTTKEQFTRQKLF